MSIQFRNEKITDHIIRILDGSDVCEYLVLGDKRAVLIDTGYGVGDLKGYVESLTDLPYEVYVTHGHVDHASGAGQFEKVHMSLLDTELFKQHCSLAFRKQMIETHTALKNVVDEDYIPQRTAPFIDIKDGETIDLGGITLKFVLVPGHTHGMIVPICPEEHVAFFGDACGVGVLLLLPESLTAAQYLVSLKKLQTFEPLYDKVLRQHGTMKSTTRVLEDNIENCEKILAGTDAHVSDELFGIPCWWACEIDPATGARKDGREGNIRYSLDHIR